MHFMHVCRLGTMLLSMVLLGCSSGSARSVTGPLSTDVDAARTRWLSIRPQAYSFEVQTSSSWSQPGGYYRVLVVNGEVAEARTPTGAATINPLPTIDSIWDQILSARAKAELNAAEFDAQGVPVESDMGPWPVDGGVHYSVRNFVIR
jgi:hypothetical protein